MTSKDLGKLKIGDFIYCVSTTMYGDNNFGATHRDISLHGKYKIISIDKYMKIRIIDDAKMEWAYSYLNFEDSIRYNRKKKLIKLNENQNMKMFQILVNDLMLKVGGFLIAKKDADIEYKWLLTKLKKNQKYLINDIDFNTGGVEIVYENNLVWFTLTPRKAFGIYEYYGNYFYTENELRQKKLKKIKKNEILY